jgi:hypothetical protein
MLSEARICDFLSIATFASCVGFNAEETNARRNATIITITEAYIIVYALPFVLNFAIVQYLLI